MYNENELKTIKDHIKLYSSVFICLVCGEETICSLRAAEYTTLIDLTTLKSQWIVVEVPAGGSMHVKGSKGELIGAVPHNSFPEKLFTNARN